MEQKKEEPKEEPPPKEPPKPKVITPPYKINKAEGVGLGTRVRDMEGKLNILVGDKEEKLKSTSFKFPSSVKATTRNIKRMIEKNKVQVIYLKQSGGIQPIIGEYRDGKIVVGNNIHNATDDIFWTWMGGKNIPTAIIPEWDIQPITRRGLMDSTEQLSTWIHPQTTILRSIEQRESLDKMTGNKMSGKMIIIIIVGAIVGGYLLFNGQT